MEKEKALAYIGGAHPLLFTAVAISPPGGRVTAAVFLCLLRRGLGGRSIARRAALWHFTGKRGLVSQVDRANYRGHFSINGRGVGGL